MSTKKETFIKNRITMMVVDELRKIVGKDNVSTDDLIIALHSKDAAGLTGKGIAVVYPENTEQVAQIVKLCYEKDIKIYPQGSSTELSGSSMPNGGVIINFGRMNKIEEINIVDGYVTVQPGVRFIELEEELSKHKYMFPIDPGSYRAATIGGAINTGAGGMRGAKYGSIVDWILGLEVVLPTGDVINIGSKTTKCRQGYNLTKLIVGSEGTLGIVTKAYLKIVPAPENIVYAAAFFEKIEDAMSAVADIKRSGILPAIMEFLDEDVVEVGRRIINSDVEGNLLIIGVECNTEASERMIDTLKEILKKRSKNIIFAKNSKEMEEKGIMELRRAFYPLSMKFGFQQLKTPTFVLIEDIAVPVSTLHKVVREIKEVAKKYDFATLIGGHAGDGNIHPIICIPTEDPEKFEKAKEFYFEIMKIALNFEGTVSAEHGIGLLKKEGLEMEMRFRKSEKALDIMRGIKKVFDPKNILNPGKIV